MKRAIGRMDLSSRLGLVAALLSALPSLALAQASRPTSGGKPECKANASVMGQSFKNNELKPVFKVSAVSGCGSHPESTGHIRYGVNYLDAKGKDTTISGFQVIWVDKKGAAFDVAPAKPETFVPEKIGRFKAVVDVKVTYCGCVN